MSETRNDVKQKDKKTKFMLVFYKRNQFDNDERKKEKTKKKKNCGCKRHSHYGFVSYVLFFPVNYIDVEYVVLFVIYNSLLLSSGQRSRRMRVLSAFMRPLSLSLLVLSDDLSVDLSVEEEGF